MHQDTILFQLATHYLPKKALRLECLFLTIEQACTETHPIIHHYALNNIFEIMKLVEKPELKSRYLKEFMRLEHSLSKSQTELAPAIYAKLFVQIQVLSHLSGRFGELIHQDTFLQSIRQTQTTHSHDGELYSPQLLLWLEHDAKVRQHNLSEWLKQLQTLYETIKVYLSLLRNSASFEAINMTNGFYQRSLPSIASCHLIMLKMPKHCGMVPKIQLGHHGLNLRLCHADSMLEVHEANTTINLAVCQLP